MKWLHTEDGYVRQDSIIGAYINSPLPEIWVILSSGDKVLYKKFEDKQDAFKELDSLIEKQFDLYECWKYKLP